MRLTGKNIMKVLLCIVIMSGLTNMTGFGLPQNRAEAAAERTFKIAVLPDTQMYSRYKPEIYNAQTEWIKRFQYSENIVFTTHLGDIVDQRTKQDEWINADKAMKILDAAGARYGYIAGNHDVADWVDDDNRNDSDQYNKYFNQYFKPAVRMKDKVAGVSPKGYSSYYTFEGGGKTFLVLFLDWRAGANTLAWANKVLEENPSYPAILATHELLNIASDRKTATMTDNGQKLWDQLIKSNDQIFLTLSGHNHGSASMVKTNDYGHEVFMSLIDYQGYYMGGNGLMRTLDFNLDAGTITAKTFSPWVMNLPEDSRDDSYDLEELTEPEAKFTVHMNFNERFKGIWDSQNRVPQAVNTDIAVKNGQTFKGKLKAADADGDALSYALLDPKPTLGTVTLTDEASGAFTYTPFENASGIDTFAFKASDGKADSSPGNVTVKIRSASMGSGEVAHWKFEAPADGSFNVKDMTGNGNNLIRVDQMIKDVPDITMEWSTDKSPFSKSDGSLQISSYKNPDEISYLRTVDEAPMNAMEFKDGYTIEAFVRIAKNFDAAKNGWMSVLARGGTGKDANKTDGDRDEPIATLSVSTLKEMQWAAYPTNLNGLKTNWSGETMFDWVHVAVVNDGHLSYMYVNGSPVLRNNEGTSGESQGIATAMRNGKPIPWIVGAYHYDNIFEKGFNGGINEIRITDHALDKSEFLINENETPVAAADTVSVSQNTVLNGRVTATDADQNPLTYHLAKEPSNGTITLNEADGSFKYTPKYNYNGSDFFTFRAYDGKEYSEETRIDVTVLPNHTPEALNGDFKVTPGEVYQGKLQATDADGDPLRYAVVKQPAKGTLQVVDAASGTFTYTPADGQEGLDYFTFQATDGKNQSLEAAVIVQISAVPEQLPEWKADNLTYTVKQNGKLTGRLWDALSLENISAGNTVTLVQQPAKGTVSVTESTYGDFEYLAHDGASGIDIMGFQFTNGENTTNVAYAVVQILPNGKATAGSLQLQTELNTAVTGQLSATDPDGDALHFRVTALPQHGTVTITDEVYGKFTFTPESGYAGLDSFSFVANDGLEDSNTAKVSIEVLAPAAAPAPGNGGGSSNPAPVPTPMPSATVAPTATAVPTATPGQTAGKGGMPSSTPNGGDSGAPAAAPFKDLAESWAKSAIDKLYARNIINGYADGTFRPNREMTRAEFAALIVKALGLGAENGGSFTDLQGHWAEPAVEAAVKAGIINGVGAARFAPEDQVTREQMAVMAVRAFQLKNEGSETNKFTDHAETSAWAKDSMNVLTGLGVVKGYADGSYRPTKSVTRAEAATLIATLLEREENQ
ncbi:tandem-95 repeat protein [Paenibacillus albidus]|uniref:Ig-like domain-containing protein n=1 Tax=Paenibacillus albidus TaxID=2041023 RepID=UPI001BEB76B8|nr:Ig-like domain-containing protein [Paenibacillus albidus]MBT2292594.1 tandem-95 repeat protein [Paenibacillus albidus]